MKKTFKALPILAVAGLTLSAVAPVFAQEGAISVISREDGSGTRGAFVEIVGVVDENDDDMTTQSAAIQNSTNGVMQTVGQDAQAIGYISLGSLDDSVKAVTVDGVEATAENIASEDYPIARPFNVAWSGDLSEVAQDFLNFINSAEGQAVVVEEGYISVDEEAPAYEAAGVEGTVEVVGSTSVSPVMEKLAEEYQALNEGVTVNITANGSSAGMAAAQDGTADIGMASRALDEDEAGALEHQAIALDGIAVIVNNDNPATDLSLDAIRSIFLGEITEWEEAVK
ncbi:phosphate ABC transporter substrate-binding protein [Suicoccus acidiformans]|uniref:Phosphate ABC transporter substrate-binding protein n=1 Tax=Suicoccus acidiformans TaxID=2036206 RepID=A0A347WNB0_9LACT|nr:substrate-binding domain-containing protein [Suicoccus acidiformans]AXY26567.1 phosphate ABC transporter substrate-binding protein [Suicoccus acidiformans]